MAEDEEITVEASPAPGTNKVEIHVGGHIVVIESTEPLSDVVGYALGLHEQTSEAATRMPMGFAASGGQFERAEPFSEASTCEPWEDRHAR